MAFDAGHRVMGHDGACRSPHGHRWTVELQVSGTTGAAGMVVDFGAMGAWLGIIHDGWDHAMLLQDGDPVADALLAVDPTFKVVRLPHPPTAEHLAATIAATVGLMAAHLPGVAVESVTVHETPNNRATAW